MESILGKLFFEHNFFAPLYSCVFFFFSPIFFSFFSLYSDYIQAYHSVTFN